MKKLLISSLILIFTISLLGFNVNSTEAQTTPNVDGTWYCQNGLPVVALSWNDYPGYTISKYYVRKNGVIVATLGPITHDYVDTNVTYNTNYRYIIEADATPTNFAAVDGGDITTGSCMYVSSVSGPSSANAGDSISVSGTYVWGSNHAATYEIGIYTSGGSAVDGATFGGAGLPLSGSQTITSPPGQITAPSTAGTYQICAKGDIPGAGLSDSKCKPITVTVPPSTRTISTNPSIISVGGSSTVNWSSSGVTSCVSTKNLNGNPNFSGWDNQPRTANAADSTTVSGFNSPTLANPYELILTCDPAPGYTSFGESDSLAENHNWLKPFLGFVKVAYAASNSVTATITVNALPNAVLNVNSSGASGVSITGLSGAPSGTTNYSSSQTSTISGTLLAPSTSGGKDFTGWSGCDNTSGYTCNVVVNTGDSPQTVTAYYSTPVPSQPNLRISSISMNPTSPAEGETVTFSATVVNDGDGSAGANSTTQLKIDLYDNGGGSSWDQTSNKTTGNLASGGSENENWNNVWTAVEGFHRIRVCADNGGVISESNESDNCTDKYVTVTTGEEPPPPPPPPPNNWDYILSNTDPVSINKEVGVGQKVITRTVTSGTPDAVSTISLSGVPSGVSASISNNPCTPSCSSTITFTVQSSVSNGTYPITATSQPGAKTLVFNLIIEGSAMNVTCVPSPATAMIGQPVTWTASVTGGSGPYTYLWSGTGVPTDPAPTVNPYSLTYSTIGAKTITAEVTDSASSTASCPANSSVQINFNPLFEEF